MRHASRERGLTLIEAMIAMAIMLIGVTGLVGLSRQGLRLNADGRRLTSAVAVAQDLVSEIESWDYADPRLANATTANDADYDDDAMLFEGAPGTFPFDHNDDDLTLGGTTWLGLPIAQVQPLGYQRYWNVAEVDDDNGNGLPDGKRIAVIVRWPQGLGWRRVVLYVGKVNPDPAERL